MYNCLDKYFLNSQHSENEKPPLQNMTTLALRKRNEGHIGKTGVLRKRNDGHTSRTCGGRNINKGVTFNSLWRALMKAKCIVLLYMYACTLTYSYVCYSYAELSDSNDGGHRREELPCCPSLQRNGAEHIEASMAFEWPERLRRPGTGHTPGPGYCRFSGDAGRIPISDWMVDVYREVTIQADHGWWWWGAGHQVAVKALEPLNCGPSTRQSVSGPAHCYGVEQTCGDQTTLQSGRRTSHCRGDRSGIAPIAFRSAVSQTSSGLRERVPNMPV